MVIVGFNYSKINVEKKIPTQGEIKINNNVAIKNVEEKKLPLGKMSQDGLRFTFEFVTTYDPGLGVIGLYGDVIYLDDPKTMKDIAASWKKDKKIPKEVMVDVLNGIVQKCHIQALILSQDIGLPPPLQLPRVQANDAQVK